MNEKPSGALRLSVGQYSSAGRKALNQDFHALCIPDEPLLGSKGAAVAIADGIGSSDVSQEASEAAVVGFLNDYYCTSAAWSVSRAARAVLNATNSWLHTQTRHSPYRDNADRGYVCAFSALVIKGAAAHLFHVGDARIYRLRAGYLEQCTEDHRLWVSNNQSHLSRALGADRHVEIDYRQLSARQGDVFLLCTDGVYEYLDEDALTAVLTADPLGPEQAARRLVEQALADGSSDNLTAQIIRIDQAARGSAVDSLILAGELPFPPELEPGDCLDGYAILRPLHRSSRSQVFLARDPDSGQLLALKLPGSDLRNDPELLERFLMEEWIARRIDNIHVLKAAPLRRPPGYLYVAMEYVEGQSLTQWMRDHPAPSLDELRDIIRQIGRGLLALHRQDTLHQDLRPDNVLIDRDGTVRIIDFGAARVGGLHDDGESFGPARILGTQQYSAPEYFMGEPASDQSDIYSLGVIAYQILSGELPYGTAVAQVSNRAARNRLNYQSITGRNRKLPVWIDVALERAVHPDPLRRYTDVAEFIHALSHPSDAHMRRHRAPLIERQPERVWQGISCVLTVLLLILLFTGYRLPGW